jgi:hypothetical protein
MDVGGENRSSVLSERADAGLPTARGRTAAARQKRRQGGERRCRPVAQGEGDAGDEEPTEGDVGVKAMIATSG